MTTEPLELLRTVYGYDSFRGDQGAVIEHTLAGGDALVLMPTGAGKSLCYQLPAMLRPGVGVVVSPLIALMHDQVGALRQLGARAAYLNSTLQPFEAQGIEREVAAGRDRVGRAGRRDAAGVAGGAAEGGAGGGAD